MSEFEERVAINDVLARYTDAVNRRDPALWGSCWSSDGAWQLADGGVVVGRHAIVETWLSIMEKFPQVTMFAMQGAVTISGESAEGVSYTNEIVCTQAGKELQITGEYADRYIKSGGQWRFHRRAFKQRRKAQL